MRFRITYGTYRELSNDVEQMAHGGILVRVPAATDVAFDAPVELELVMPNGESLETAGRVLQVLAGHGVAVTIEPHFTDQVRRFAVGSDSPNAKATRHERVERAERVEPEPVAAPPAHEPSDGLTIPQKIQLALHGTRDQRNAILRDHNRTLHAYVLKNPQITSEDVLAIAKNPQMGPEIYKQIAERPDWFQRPQIALALARNPKVPGDIAVRALAHVPLDALRQLAKGTGAPPHVVQAARKRVVGTS